MNYGNNVGGPGGMQQQPYMGQPTGPPQQMMMGRGPGQMQMSLGTIIYAIYVVNGVL